MSLKTDREDILNSLESEYASDLAIHLYSTYLLRRVNPLFPKREWSAWPLPIDKVPVPKDNYEDDIATEYKEDIGTWQEEYNRNLEDWLIKFERRTIHSKKVENSEKRDDLSSNVSSNEDSNSESESDSNSDNDSDSDNDNVVEINPRKRILEVLYKRRMINSKTALANSISSILQSKIESKILKLKQEGTISKNSEPSDTISENPALKLIIEQLATRFNGMLNRLTYFRKTNDWQQVLVSAIQNEIKPHQQLNTDMYRDLYSKCEKLFNDIDYKFEFENEDEEEEEDGLQTESNGVISSNGAFNVVEYLKSLGEKNTAAKYRDFAAKYQQELGPRREEQNKIRRYFFGALDIQDQYKKVTWENTSTSKIVKKRRQMNPDRSNIMEVKNDILSSTTLDENSYILNL